MSMTRFQLARVLERERMRWQGEVKRKNKERAREAKQVYDVLKAGLDARDRLWGRD
jgi:hypothetical protein